MTGRGSGGGRIPVSGKGEDGTCSRLGEGTGDWPWEYQGKAHPKERAFSVPMHCYLLERCLLFIVEAGVRTVDLQLQGLFKA